MNLTHRPALEFSLSELGHLMTACFEDYFVPFNMDASRIARMLRMDGVNLEFSRIAMNNNTPMAMGFITQRGRLCRLGGMGVIKSHRGTGIGNWLVSQLIQDARQRGDGGMVLEVIEQNEPAIGLYKKSGFQIRRRLVGYSAEALSGAGDDRLAAVDPKDVVRALVRHGPQDLPWQNSPEAFANAGSEFEGFRLDQAFALLIVQPEMVVVQSLVVAPERRRQGQARQLMLALLDRFKDCAWRVPITLPEDIMPGLFESLGFKAETLSQFEMQLQLD